jgi:oxygen-independent coproporphyrinogen-3 oxidase
LQAGLPAGNNISIYSIMAGIYVHIPFCRQACFYCNFHFVTSLTYKNELLNALLRETEMQKDFLEGETIETIYFGGGTPSILHISDLELQLDKIRSLFTIQEGSEITIEANPDDITKEKLIGWKKIGINRLSIGVQSFFDDDLQWMNRAHSAKQAIDNLSLATEHFENITIDLIYGTPGLTDDKWKQNVEKAFAYNIPHLSCYALTVEPKTPLQKMINEKKMENVNPDRQSSQFLLLMQWMQDAGYEHYEISNFSKPGFRSRHNSAYWEGRKYLGLGPAAHSFNGESRQWNISNNNNYIESIRRGILPIEKEILSPVQQLNEYIMTSLRTIEGLDLKKISENKKHELINESKKFIERGLIKEKNECLILTKEGKLLADGIAADLFFN